MHVQSNGGWLGGWQAQVAGWLASRLNPPAPRLVRLQMPNLPLQQIVAIQRNLTCCNNPSPTRWNFSWKRNTWMLLMS